MTSPSSSKLLLGLDPSESRTGVVLAELSEGLTLLESHTLPVQKVLAWLKYLETPPDVVVLERPALGAGADHKTISAWQMLEWECSALFREAKICHIGPSQWKPYMAVQHLRLPKLKSEHERDAYKLLWYWWWFRHG